MNDTFHEIKCSACNRVIAFTNKTWYIKARPLFSCVDCYFKSVRAGYNNASK